MTVELTAANIKTRMEALKETVTNEEDEEEEITIFDTVVIGNIDSDKMPPGTSMSIRAVTEEAALNFAGPDIPPSPFTTPWHLTLYVTGQVSEATSRIYHLIPLIKESLLIDMTFGGSCTEAWWPEPHLIYDEVTTKTGMISGARFILMANYNE